MILLEFTRKTRLRRSVVRIATLPLSLPDVQQLHEL